MKKIITTVGLAGSGKTEAIDYLKEKYKWPKVYFPESLFEEIKNRNMELNWENEEFMRSELRKIHGNGVFAKLAIPKIDKLLEESDVVLVESMYTWDEYKIMKEKYGDNFIVISIFTPKETRFRRLNTRPVRPITTMEDFNKRDWSEIEVIGKAGPIAIADYLVMNDKTKGDLFSSIDKTIDKILK